jgi:peptidylprolyl isomerase
MISMRSRVHSLLLCAALAVSLGACTLKDDGAGPAAPPIPAPADVAAPPADAVRTPTGIASKILRVGLGRDHPGLASTVVVHYTGWTTDGKMFDSSVARGEPATFGLRQVIPGWTEALQLMVTGEKRRFWIPGDLAYDQSPDPTTPKGLLVFDIELIQIK